MPHSPLHHRLSHQPTKGPDISFDQVVLVGTIVVFGLETKVISVPLSFYNETCNHGLDSNTMIDDDYDDEIHRKYNISI